VHTKTPRARDASYPRTCRPSGSLWPRSGSRLGLAATQGAASNHKKARPDGQPAADREGLGKSRGGWTTKIHLIADSRCRPLARITTAGQRGDSLAFEPLMARLAIRRRGRGRVRTRPARLLADKAYSTNVIRAELRRRDITAVIPIPSNQQEGRRNRGSRGGLGAPI
jgi:hypothetical protein